MLFRSQQLLRSPLRAHKLKDANIVFLPLYLGIAQKLVLEYQHDQTHNLFDDFWREYMKSDEWISRLPHWVALADIELLYQAGCGGWGMSTLCHKEHILPSALVISTPEPFLGPNPEQPLNFTRAYKSLGQIYNVVAVPYFSHVHLSRTAFQLQEAFNASVCA